MAKINDKVSNALPTNNELIDNEQVVVNREVLSNSETWEDEDDEEFEMERICQNCSYFFQKDDNAYSEMGICTNEAAFDPHQEKLLDDEWSPALTMLFNELQFSGERECCEQFEEIETLDLPEGMSFQTYQQIEERKTGNTEYILEFLKTAPFEDRWAGVDALSDYLFHGNQSAHDSLIKYYNSLGPVESLEDTKLRVRMVELMTRRNTSKEAIDAFVLEMERTPSNSTSRQLYTKILDVLHRCPIEMIEEPLQALLVRKKFSPKIKQRITDTSNGIGKYDGYWF